MGDRERQHLSDPACLYGRRRESLCISCSRSPEVQRGGSGRSSRPAGFSTAEQARRGQGLRQPRAGGCSVESADGPPGAFTCCSEAGLARMTAGNSVGGPEGNWGWRPVCPCPSRCQPSPVTVRGARSSTQKHSVGPKATDHAGHLTEGDGETSKDRFSQHVGSSVPAPRAEVQGEKARSTGKPKKEVQQRGRPARLGPRRQTG